MRPFLSLCVLVFGLVSQVPALETSPRIGDREIIESLVEIKTGQKALQERFDDRFRIMEQRFDQLWNLILVLIAGIIGLVGFVVWDRKTAMRPPGKAA